jgi:hypothetical protein
MGNGFSADAGNGSAVATACLVNSFAAVLMHAAPVSRGGMMAEANNRIAIDAIGHGMGHRPKRGGCGLGVVR